MTVPGTPSLLVAGVTDAGKLRANNEDAHWYDDDAGIAIVCDGMGGHQAGEVASRLAVRMVRERWTGADVERARVQWLRAPTPATRRALVAALRAAVLAANQAIIALSEEDDEKEGMGTTFTGAVFVGDEALVAHAGDSRVYLVRGGVARLLTEDHTLIARLAEAGVETGDPNRWKGVVTNALGVGEPTWVSVSAVPLCDGDRLLLCSDGISEYLDEAEIGAVLTTQASPARAARALVDLALERGGQDNATAVVVKVVEAGAEAPEPDARARDDEALDRCALFRELTLSRRLRVLAISTRHVIHDGEPLPASFLGERVAWVVIQGAAYRGGERGGRGALLYPESLVATSPPPPEADWIARGDVHAIAVSVADLDALVHDEPDLGEKLWSALARR